jgi:hypothetical protein
MENDAGEATTLGRYGRATTRAFRPRLNLTFDEWVRAGRQIARISSASAWWVGDWLVYGERAYGTRYRAALELTSFDYKTLRNYAWVARRFDMSRRRDALSFQHHAEVAALDEPEQELWLNRAEMGRWTRNELRRQLAAGRGASGSRDRAIEVRIRVEAQRERRWREAAKASHQSLPEWISAAADQVASTVPAHTTLTSLPGRGHAARALPAGGLRREDRALTGAQ